MSQELTLSLFADLRSPDVAIRFSVLSRLENISWNDELSKAFAIMAQTESDPTVKLYMRLILERAGQKQQTSLDSTRLCQELTTLIQKPDTDQLRLALILEILPRDSIETAAAILKSRTLNDYPAIVLPFILRFIKKHRLTEMTGQIEPLCRHHNPQILAAAIETLEKLDPQKLENLLVPLLTNDNPGIRSRAVRLLFRLDPQEAIKHFQAMLFSPDLGDRNAAMFHAYFFPFEKIESAMLRFMAVESGPELLKKAGYLFQVNPGLEPPLNLIEIIEGSSGNRREIFSEILRGVLAARSRLLNRPGNELLDELKAACRKKKANELVAQCRLAWETANPAQRQAMAGKLEQLAKSGHAEARALLTDLDSEPAVASLPAEVIAPDADLAQMSSEARITIWKASDSEFNRRHPEIPGLWAKMNPEEKTVVLARILQTGNTALAREIGERAMRDSNEIVVAAAVETLQQLDADSIFPLLPSLIVHPSTAVQSAAISVYAIYDKDQAVRLLEKMLGQSATARANALFHLAQFDFPAVSNILMNCLMIEDNPANLQKIEAILTSNIDYELAYQVFVISRNENGTRRASLENMFSRLGNNLISRNNDRSLSLIGLIDQFAGRFAKEKEKSANAPAWSLENIKKLRQQKIIEAPPPVTNENLTAFALGAFAVSALTAWLIWVAILSPLLPSLPASQNDRLAPDETLLIGTVEKVMPFAVEIRPEGSSKNVQIILPKVQQGRRLRLRVKNPGSSGQAELMELLSHEKQQ